MNRTLKFVLQAGVSDTTNESRARAIILCNTIALIAVTLSTIFLVYVSLNGWNRVETIILVAITIMALIPFMNFMGMVNASRFLLPLVLPLLTLIVTLMIRVQNP